MSKYRGRVAVGLCVLSLFFATTHSMESSSFETFSLQTLGTLYVRLKEDIEGIRKGQKKYRKSLKEIKEEQRYLLLILAELQHDQRTTDKEIKRLRRKINKRVREMQLHLKTLGGDLKQRLEHLKDQCEGGGYWEEEREEIEGTGKNSGGRFVVDSFLSDDPDGELQ